MLMFLIPIMLLSSGVNSLGSFTPEKHSVASESQIRFAIENKYDQTGPGAKGREQAYSTYKDLDEALIGYLDDPDTKLPEYEKAKATQKLYSLQSPQYQKPTYLNAPYSSANVVIHPSPSVKVVPKEYSNLGYWKNQGAPSLGDQLFEFQKIQVVKGNPLNLAHYMRGVQSVNQFKPSSQYSLHNEKLTDESNAAQDIGDRLVHGFYTFTDADGQQRTIQYTGEDAQGFRTLVRRTANNQ